MRSFTNDRMLIAIPWQGQQWPPEVNLTEICVAMSLQCNQGDVICVVEIHIINNNDINWSICEVEF